MKKFNQLLHCTGMALPCIVKNDDVSFTRSRRVNKRISMQNFRLKVYLFCIIMYCQD